MKKENIIETGSNFIEYKKIIDEYISNNSIDKLKFEENYFDICQNYWIIDKYIAKDGQVNLDSTPNTLPTYEEAINNNYAICIPVQMLDDGSIVCFSHKCLSKVVSTENGYLNTHSLKEIKQIALNEKNDKIPTLSEALNHIKNRAPIIVEIINEGMIGKMEDSILSILASYIKDYNCHNNIAIMSINPYTLEYCYQSFPYITRILKSGDFQEKTYSAISTKKLRKLKLYKITHADFICYSATKLPYSKIKKHKPVAVLADIVTSQNQYLSVAPHCDNIIFKNFKPTI